MKRASRALAVGVLLFETAAGQEPSFADRIVRQQSQGAANTASQAPVAAGSATQGDARHVAAPSSERTRDFVRAVLGDTEDVWGKLFAAMGQPSYPRPTIVLVHRSTGSACGSIDVSVGPRYCAADQRIYLDTASLDKTIGQSGDFAGAYLIVREVGHHVQSVLGTTRPLDGATRAEAKQATKSALDRQADCLVGVWTYSVQKRGLLDPGEAEKGAAAAIQTAASRTKTEAAADRLRGFRQGLATGDPRSCDLPAPPDATSRPRK